MSERVKIVPPGPEYQGRTVLLQGGRLVQPDDGVREGVDVLVEDGQIVAIGEGIEAGRAERVVDLSGLTIAPALTDIHVHFREPGGEASETVLTGCRAAAVGGYARVWCMPNTNPTIDSPMVVRSVLESAARAWDAGWRVRVGTSASITKGLAGEVLTDFSALRDAGARCLTDDGKPVPTAGTLRTAMLEAKSLGMLICEHCEDLSITGDGVMHAGEVAARLGLSGIPRSSETLCVWRDGLLALETGCRLHVQHVSTKTSVDAIRRLKEMGSPITAEVSPHHLLFTHERVLGVEGSHLQRAGDPHAKMKPALCEESDRLALIEALEDGTIDCIATDHAPHSPASKATTFDKAPFGIIGLEAAFAALHTRFVVEEGRWDLAFLIDRMAVAPGRVVGEEYGVVGPGQPADLVVIDEGKRWVLGEESLGSKSRNCPWLGQEMIGGVVGTMVEGRWSWATPSFGSTILASGPRLATS